MYQSIDVGSSKASLTLANQTGGALIAVIANAQSDGSVAAFGLMANLQSLGDVVAAGASKTFDLPAGEAQSRLLYFLRPGSFFPIKTMRVYSQNGGPAGAEVKVDASDEKAAAGALDLWRLAMASVTSDIVLSLQKVMASADGLGADEAEAALAKWFATTAGTGDTDFGAFATMYSWLAAYAYLWGMDGQGAPGTKYVVYDATTIDTDPDQVATLDFSAPATEPSGPMDRSNGFTISLTRERAGPEELQYEARQLADGGLVVLSGIFGQRSWFTSDTSGPSQVPMFVGELDGYPVIALPFAIPETGGGNSAASTSTDAVNDDTASDDPVRSTAELVLAIVGGVSSLFTIVLGVATAINAIRSWRANRNGGNGTAEQQQAARRAGAEAARQTRDALNDDIQRIGGRLNQIPTVEQFTQQMNKLRQAMGDTLKANSRERIAAGIEGAAKSLSELAEFGNPETLQEAVASVQNARVDLKAGKLKEAAAKVQAASAKGRAATAEFSASMKEGQQRAFEESWKAAEIEADLAREAAEAAERAEEGLGEMEEEAVPDL